MKHDIVLIIGQLGGNGWGGAHKVVTILANYFARKNYNVTMIVWKDSAVDCELDKKINVVTLHCKIKNKMDVLLPCILTRKILLKHKGAYVYILISRMAAYAAFYSLFCGVKIIGSERTDPKSEPGNAVFRLIRNITFCLLYRSVFQTPNALAYFPKHVQKRAKVIPNPLSPDLPKPFQGERKKEFVTFCRIDKQKNLHMMIDSFIQSHKKHPDFCLRIYGTGLIEKDINEYIVSQMANEFITMEGFCKRVHEKIIDSYAFLSSSNYEGLSNSMLEALAIGLPCICTDCPVGGTKMYIRNGENGLLVPVGDSAAMASAINILIETPSLCSKLSSNAVRIRELLDTNKICEQWERLMD